MSWSTVETLPQVAPKPGVDEIPDYSSALTTSVPITLRASSNEARDGLSRAVEKAVVARLATINRYPTLGAGDTAALVAAKIGARTEEVALADGSLSILNYLLLTYVRPGQGVVYAWRSYEAYPICVRTAGGTPRGLPNRPDGTHDLAAMATAVDGDTAVVILCSPNNPTGTALTHREVSDFLAALPATVLVVLDEAYIDFDTRDEAPRSRELLAEHPNLVILRTFSKAFGLAGIRVGYAVAHPEVIRNLRKLLPPFTVNALAQVAVAAALEDEPARDEIVSSVIAQRSQVVRLLDRYGVPYVGSHANFVWLPLGVASDRLGMLCAARGLSTRVFSDEGIRISLGEPALLAVLDDALDVFALS